MTSYQILYWHDIPAQVRAGGRRDRVSVQLAQRFQEAIDAAAMSAGLIGSDDYTNAFVWGDPAERDGTPHFVANAVAAELEDKFAVIDWKTTVAVLSSKSDSLE